MRIATASRVLAGFAIASGAAATAVLVVLLLADRFKHGATLSGINPDGGGPGILLLTITAIAGLITEWKLNLFHEFIPRVTEALVGVGIVAAAMLAIGVHTLPEDFPPFIHYAAPTAAAYGVARITAASFDVYFPVEDQDTPPPTTGKTSANNAPNADPRSGTTSDTCDPPNTASDPHAIMSTPA